MSKIKEIFDAKKEYDKLNQNFDLPKLPDLYTKYYIDTWKVSPFYGKVDTLGIPVIPKYSLIRYCTYGTDKEQLMALQPAAEFFFALRKQYEDSYSRGEINKNDNFFKKELSPKKAFINSNLEYPELMQTKYRNFVDYLLVNKKFNIIKNYDDFLEEILIYIKTTNTYFTRAGYVESLDYSLLHTGLAIDVYQGNVQDDKDRTSFFSSVNSTAFLELCIRNNLKIDREIPWRVFLDIRTKGNDSKHPSFEEKIKDFIPEFKEDLQLFFDKYYDRVVPYDDNSYVYFLEFKELLEAFYFSFVESYPFYKTYLINDCGKSNVKKMDRNILPDKIKILKYIKLYLQFRNIELAGVVPEEKLMQYYEICVDMFKEESDNKSVEEVKKTILKTFKYYTNNVGTLAYRSPSLYEIDKNQKNG